MFMTFELKFKLKLTLPPHFYIVSEFKNHSKFHARGESVQEYEATKSSSGLTKC